MLKNSSFNEEQEKAIEDKNLTTAIDTFYAMQLQNSHNHFPLAISHTVLQENMLLQFSVGGEDKRNKSYQITEKSNE